MSFHRPYLAILGLFLLIAYVLKFFQVGKKAELVIPRSQIGESSKTPIGRWICLLLSVSGIAFLSLSLTQPRLPLGYAKNKIEVNDIFLVVDVSRSMLAEDFKPNRLVVAKEKIREFIKLRPTDRIGIVIYGEKAFTLLPLSTDLKLIDEMVNEIQVGFLGSGTNIGDALALAVGRATQSLAKNKVIILLTDGVSNVGNMTPIQAAEEANKIGVKVYTIGIGKKGNSRSLKSGLGYQRLPGGSVDLDTLDKISAITNGKSYYAGNTESLSSVLKEIQSLEKTEIDASSKIIYKELYWKYLLWGMLLFLSGELIARVRYREAL
jgi:Ca-activated chloride channel family protein